MLNRGKNIRLFTHPWLEAVSHVHPAIPGLLYGPLAVYCIGRAVLQGISPWVVCGLVAAGIVCLSLGEYALHRGIFHFRPRTPRQERVWYILHGIHHDDPNDATRLVMPPIITLLLAVGVYVGARAVFGPMQGPCFFAGMAIGYLLYDYIHLYIHHARPRTRLGRSLRRHHLQHHYAEEPVNFGVSSPLWDVVFRTYHARTH